jgi:hypothetical protein
MVRPAYLLLLVPLSLALSGCLVPGYCSGSVYSVTAELISAAKTPGCSQHRKGVPPAEATMLTAELQENGELAVRVVTEDGTLHELACDRHDERCSDGAHVLSPVGHGVNEWVVPDGPIRLSGSDGNVPGVWAAGTTQARPGADVELRGKTIVLADGRRLASFSGLCTEFGGKPHRCNSTQKIRLAPLLALPVTLALDALLFSTQVALVFPLFGLLGALLAAGG